MGEEGHEEGTRSRRSRWSALVAIAARAGRAAAAPAGTQDAQLTGTGSTFVFPLVSKWIPRARQCLREQRHVLADRLRCRHRAGHGPDRRLRRVGRAAVAGPARSVQGLRRDPVGALRRHRSRTTSRGLNGRSASTGRRSREHLPRARSPTGTTGRSRRSTRSCNLPNHEDHAGLPLGQLRHDLQLHRVSVERSARSGSRRSGATRAVNFPTGVGARGSSGVAGIVSKTEGALDLRRRRVLDQEQVHVRARSRTARASSRLPGLRGINAGASRGCRRRSRTSRSSRSSIHRRAPASWPIRSARSRT